MGKVKRKLKNKWILLSVIIIGILLMTIGLFYSSFALPEPVRSISFTSSKLNYNEKTPGSWKLEESSEWIDKGKARVTIDIDTILKEKETGTDLILVLDTSESMRGEGLEKEKEASIKFIEQFLSNSNNQISLVDKNIMISDFTNDKNLLINKINNLNPSGSSFYYNALLGIDTVLRNHNRDNSKNCEALLISGDYLDAQNSVAINSQNYFKLLKTSYPDVTIHTIQYEQGSMIIESMKKVSDIQYLANINNIEQVLLNIPINSTTYDEFILTESIDTNSFFIESSSDIKVSEGNVSFNQEEQGVIWTINSLKSGTKPKMTMDIKLNEDLLDVGGVYSISKSLSLHTKIGEDIEDATSTDTPILKDYYEVSFEANAPEGCTVSNIPESKNQFVFDKVDISVRPTCEGYQFKGWSILTDGVKQINEDYFIMPERDVILRAEWSKMSISKSMNGEIYIGPPSIIRKVKSDGDIWSDVENEDIWQYKSEITRIVFENKMDEAHIGLEEFDISEEKNGSVMAYYDSSTTTVYIQGNKKIYANADSSCLFLNFTNLKGIDGLEYFDTSNATSMLGLFSGCNSLENLDVSNFDTSNVTNMYAMFNDCQSLTVLDVTNFNTSKVNDMCWMFRKCINLKRIYLATFDTSNVTNMTGMFGSCQSLISLNLSNFDTSKVTTMLNMFNNCLGLVNLDVSSFNTSNVTDMTSMFNSCKGLENLKLGDNFDTSNVTDMYFMFYACNKVTTTITILNPNVVTYTNMFLETAINGGKVIVNYTSQTSSLVDRMIATKTSNATSGRYSNVVKGVQVTI